MKADILNLRYCEKCIDKKVMWVLYKWYPYVLKKYGMHSTIWNIRTTKVSKRNKMKEVR